MASSADRHAALESTYISPIHSLPIVAHCAAHSNPTSVFRHHPSAGGPATSIPPALLSNLIVTIKSPFSRPPRTLRDPQASFHRNQISRPQQFNCKFMPQFSLPPDSTGYILTLPTHCLYILMRSWGGNQIYGLQDRRQGPFTEHGVGTVNRSARSLERQTERYFMIRPLFPVGLRVMVRNQTPDRCLRSVIRLRGIHQSPGFLETGKLNSHHDWTPLQRDSERMRTGPSSKSPSSSRVSFPQAAASLSPSAKENARNARSTSSSAKWHVAHTTAETPSHRLKSLAKAKLQFPVLTGKIRVVSP